MTGEKSLTDGIGIVLSWVCIVHCLLLPLVIPFLPFLVIFNRDGFHEVLAVVLLSVAASAFYRGYRVHHERKIVVNGALGISLLFVALMLPGHEAGREFYAATAVNVIGSIFLIRAHLKNIQLCRCSFDSDHCACSTESDAAV